MWRNLTHLSSTSSLSTLYGLTQRSKQNCYCTSVDKYAKCLYHNYQIHWVSLKIYLIFEIFSYQGVFLGDFGGLQSTNVKNSYRFFKEICIYYIFCIFMELKLKSEYFSTTFIIYLFVFISNTMHPSP